MAPVIPKQKGWENVSVFTSFGSKGFCLGLVHQLPRLGQPHAQLRHNVVPCLLLILHPSLDLEITIVFDTIHLLPFFIWVLQKESGYCSIIMSQPEQGLGTLHPLLRRQHGAQHLTSMQNNSTATRILPFLSFLKSRERREQNKPCVLLDRCPFAPLNSLLSPFCCHNSKMHWIYRKVLNMISR